MRLLVCGGRHYDDEDHVNRVLDAIHAREGVDVLIEGGATGADWLARQWAEARGVRVETYRADWGQHGRRAGYLRNVRMAEEGKPDAVLPFPGGEGTAMMVDIARRSGIRVITLEECTAEYKLTE